MDEPGAVETLYFESQDQLYIDYSDRIRLLCDPTGPMSSCPSGNAENATIG